MLMMLIAAAAMTPPSDMKDIRDIQAQRRRSNAAIAAHRFDDMRPILLPDYHLLPGSLGKPLDVAESASRLAKSLGDPLFVTYVRTPDAIKIAANRKRAAETGHWLGSWREPDGLMRLSGVYQAMWVPTPGGWRLLNESFISLRCTGSSACGKFD